jgi:hypothetical protein
MRQERKGGRKREEDASHAEMGEENKMNKMKYSGTSTKRILRRRNVRVYF